MSFVTLLNKNYYLSIIYLADSGHSVPWDTWLYHGRKSTCCFWLFWNLYFKLLSLLYVNVICQVKCFVILFSYSVRFAKANERGWLCLPCMLIYSLLCPSLKINWQWAGNVLLLLLLTSLSTPSLYTYAPVAAFPYVA